MYTIIAVVKCNCPCINPIWVPKLLWENTPPEKREEYYRMLHTSCPICHKLYEVDKK